jgi:hypothetical protein
MKFSGLAKDGLIAPGKELVGITLEFKGKLQVPALKQRGIFQKSYLKSLKRKATVRDMCVTLTKLDFFGN